MWIEDTYGDGGHQATGIEITFSFVISEIEWLMANLASGTIPPGECIDITVLCDATELEPGMHEGLITVSSNDPEFPEVEIPVYFEVTALGNLTISPDTLWFIDENAIFEGRTATILNSSSVDVTIDEIQEFGNLWLIQEMSQTIPYTLAPAEEMTFHVMIIQILVEDFINMEYDSVYVSSSAGDYYVTLAVDTDLIVDVETIDNNQVNVYPSPFTNLLIIDLSKYNGTIENIIISDLSGRVVKTFDKLSMNDRQLIWNCNDARQPVGEGIYLVQIISENKSEVIKVIKMK